MSERLSNPPAGNQACLGCRSVKTKCKPIPGDSKCERCRRKSQDCVFYHRKRGRKPGARTELQDRDRAGNRAPDISRQAPNPRSVYSPQVQESTNNDAVVINSPLHIQKEPNTAPIFWEEPESLQPAGLLEKQGMSKGTFSLEHILSTSSDSSTNRTESNGFDNLPEQEPISLGLVTYHVASSLFHGFMQNLNPFVCVLDPLLYTFPYVQSRSSFLLTVILAASAKAFNPALYPILSKHSEELYVTSFQRGTRSIETVQAILLLTYWKRPDDTRSWSAIGYAIRLCMELGLHRLPGFNASLPDPILETERRQKRNTERTWLVMFVYDRSMTLQTGKPWMIERSDFIESVNYWYKCPLATPEDTVLASLVTIRLATADFLEILNPQRPSPPMDQPQRVNSLLRTLNPQIHAWQKHWIGATRKDPVHEFLVSFFGSHIRLLLYSFPLQASLYSPVGGSLIDNEAFWIAYTSALEMLELTTGDALSPYLGFAHDSIHVMVAYAAVFLIKLLLSVHKALRDEIETSVIQMIKRSATVFEQQSAPPTFSCALQANFLSNAVKEYEGACQQRRGQNRIASSKQPSAQNETASGVHHDSQKSSGKGSLTNNHEMASSPNISHASSSAAQIRNVRSGSGNQYHSSPARHQAMQPAGSNETAGQTIEESSEGMFDGGISDDYRPYGPVSQNLFIGNDDTWASMFINAGFDPQAGAFLPGGVRAGNFGL